MMGVSDEVFIELATLETHNHFWGVNIMKTFDNKLYLENKT